MKNNNLMGIAVIVLVIAVLVLAFGKLDFSKEPSSDNVIRANGEAERDIIPDTVEVHIVIETQGEDKIQIGNENAAISRKVMNGIRSLGVSEVDIQTLNYNINPKYDYIKGKRVQDGFIASNSLKIKLDRIYLVGDVIAVGIENGATRIGNVQYSIDKNTEEEIKSELLKEATENARRKAESIASGLNVKLGKIVSVSEGSVIYRPYFLESDTIAKAETAVAEGVAVPEINPRELTIRANVNVVYYIK